MRKLIQVKAEDLQHNQTILYADGTEARVWRIARIDHERGRLDTSLGKSVVPLDMLFRVVSDK